MYQEEENELDALQSAKELEEEKKRAKEQQAKMVNYPLVSSIIGCVCAMLQDDIALVICMIVIMLVTCAVVFVKVIPTITSTKISSHYCIFLVKITNVKHIYNLFSNL